MLRVKEKTKTIRAAYLYAISIRLITNTKNVWDCMNSQAVGISEAKCRLNQQTQTHREMWMYTPVCTHINTHTHAFYSQYAVKTTLNIEMKCRTSTQVNNRLNSIESSLLTQEVCLCSSIRSRPVSRGSKQLQWDSCHSKTKVHTQRQKH